MKEIIINKKIFYLSLEYILGLFEGDGSIYVQLKPNSSHKTGKQVILNWDIHQHVIDVDLLHAISTYFNCGKVEIGRKIGGKESWIYRYRISNQTDILNILLPILKSSDMVLNKRNHDKLLFIKICQIIQNKEHITLEGQNLCSGEATIFLLGLDKPRLWGCTIRSLSRRNNAILSVPLGRFAFNSLKDIAGSIRKLALLDCGIRDSQILADFLNHFRSLSILLISWDSKTKFIQQNHPPPARPRHSDCSLLSLAIEIVPNISTLLSFFIETRPLVNNLKYLMVACSFSNLIVLLQEIDELLLHCSHSIQELSIVVGHFLEQNYAQDAGISSNIK